MGPPGALAAAAFKPLCSSSGPAAGNWIKRSGRNSAYLDLQASPGDDIPVFAAAWKKSVLAL